MSTFVILGLAALILTANSSNVPTCYNDTYYDAESTITAANYCTYPTRKINAQCVAAGCPDLTKESLCPVKDDGDINVSNVEKTIAIVNGCLQQPTVCHVPLNPIPIPYFTMEVSQLLQGTTLTGFCQTFGHLLIKNVSNTIVGIDKSTQQPDNQLRISVSVNNLSYEGNFKCKLKSEALSKLLNESIEFNFSNVSFGISLQIQTYSIQNLTNVQIKPNVEVAVASVTSTEDDFNVGFFSPILNRATKAFLTFLQTYIRTSGVPEAFGEFVSAIVDSAFNITKQQC
ncbi:hypothetical protein CHUAL_006494 [Chamberlinius hualienensis]